MFFITTVNYLTQSDKVNAYCWGYFPSKEVAEGVIYRDRVDFHDMMYPYLVIEAIEEDITNPSVREVTWYRYDEAMLEWKPCDRPSELSHISAFALRR